MPAKARGRRWIFKARSRRRAFGWRSQPAIQRIKEAVIEIKKVARENPALGGEGAVAFLERLSPALEQVESSSGAVGRAVNRTIDELVPIVAGAPTDARTRREWLERLERLCAALEAEMPKGTPRTRPAAHWETSPALAVTEAMPPTLQQHGRYDTRVPLVNALTMHRALLDADVPSKLYIVSETGHGISAPEQGLEARWQNWSWFARYLEGEEWARPDTAQEGTCRERLD